MNRHDRRAAASKERRGQDTMGKSYTVSGVPESVSNLPAFKEGQRRADSGEGLPPAYYEAIEQAADAIRSYLAAHRSKPDLRWLEWDKGRVFLAANLDRGASYLADSPDAFALLAWLDAATGRKLSIDQAGWALRLAGLMPMPQEVTP